MTASDRVVMQNPNTGRDDNTIAREIFEPVRYAILDALEDAEDVAFKDLTDEVVARTPAVLWSDRSPMWYTTTVKLHLEATGEIEKFGKPQRLRRL